ncbi:MAG: amidase family protein [Pseudomonadota bacterium]
MAYQTPSAARVVSLARSLDWEISDKQAAALQNFLTPFADGYEWLDQQTSSGAENNASGRTYEFPKDNPHNAWFARTEIPTNIDGVLSGKSIAVKDNIFVAGVPVSNGSSFLQDHIADYDATVVTRILNAGGNIIGKSNCEYFCLSGGSATSSHGVVENPRRAGYSTAGSSSGSAALVAGGYVDMALGTDQGGSVRSPASWSGVCGMKATRGLVPYQGGIAIESTVDYIGPMTRRVADNALLLDVIAESQSRGFAHRFEQALDGLRIGVLREGFAHPLSDPVVDESVLSAVRQFEPLGAEIIDVSVPMHLNGLAIWGAIVTDGFWQTLKLRGLGYNLEGKYSTSLANAMTDWQQHIGEMPINAQVLMLLGKHVEQYAGKYYFAAKNHVERLRADYDAIFEQVDVLAMPTTVQRAGPNPAPDDINGIFAQAFNNTINTAQFNATGHPALSIPCAMRDELPIGLMFVGRYREEALLYQAAHWFEQSLDWTLIVLFVVKDEIVSTVNAPCHRRMHLVLERGNR